MALVSYSDSETSDVEAPAVPVSTASKRAAAGPAFQKVEPRKIKVDLPTVTADVEAARPAKRAKTAGTFGGFNSLLPAPKKPSGVNAPGRGVSLKTSSEAAFSRRPVAQDEEREQDQGTDDARVTATPEVKVVDENESEVKPVGKATKFKPLSVQAGQKKKKKVVPFRKDAEKDSTGAPKSQADTTPADPQGTALEAPAPVPKPKRSLFSMAQSEEQELIAQDSATSTTYEAMTSQPASTSDLPQRPDLDVPPPAPSNSIDALTSDLNLSAAERRRLFGRNAKHGDMKIAHFNMDAEYASNEQLRQAGDVVEHRAVKAVAPGKHSLQQLVNNARSQQENLEDKWAEGRRERGEGQGRYGWGK